MVRRGNLIGVFLLILAPSSALAVPLSVSVGVGAAAPEVADPVGYMTSLSVLARFDDSFGGYASVWRMGFPAKGTDVGVEYDYSTALVAGVEYRLSVGGTVPYLRAGGGIVGAPGSPSVSAPMVEFGLGSRWRLNESWDMGAELGRYAPMDELGGIGGGSMLQLHFAYRFEI